MQQLSSRPFGAAFLWHGAWLEVLVSACIALVVFVEPAGAAMRFQDRSLYMRSAEPGATTSYTVSFRYMSPDAIASVDMLFCNDPIPYHECVTPEGLDVSGATLGSQVGEAGFSILSQSTNRIVLSRSPSAITHPASSYTFDNIVNPTSTTDSFSIRLRSHAMADASGPQVDFGSIKGQVTTSIVIETQVPPMLIFCVAEEVADNCADTNGVYYADMGTLNPQKTLTAQSQMAVGTNASGGFAITANGGPLSAGVNVIQSPKTPTASRTGENQFGINLVQNDAPVVGGDPEGDWANAIPSPDYAIANQYKFEPGNVVAYSPNVSLMKKFTVSYIINSSNSLKAGVYTTTITYIASGQF